MPVTDMEIFAQYRLPEPVEEEMSKVKASHSLREVGTFTATLGFTADVYAGNIIDKFVVDKKTEEVDINSLAFIFPPFKVI